MSETDLLLWARGPAFQWALGIFLFGTILRVFEMFSLGRKRDLSPPCIGSPGSGWRTIVTRSLSPPSVWRRSLATYVLGYGFHLGLLVCLLFFAPHIQIARNLLGLSWPALPTPWVDAVALLTLVVLLLMMAHRYLDPVKRFLSTPGDYLTLVLILLPMLSGYLAFHHQALPYTLMLALHILSAELLLALMPFTKLIHFASIFPSRWYNGDIAGHKGVAS